MLNYEYNYNQKIQYFNYCWFITLTYIFQDYVSYRLTDKEEKSK